MEVIELKMEAQSSFIIDQNSNVGDFHVCIHPSKMQQLGLSDGAAVLVKSKTKSFIAAAASSKTTCGVSYIRMSRAVRYNLNAYLGQIVLVSPLGNCAAATRNVVLSPVAETVEGIVGSLSTEIFEGVIDFSGMPIAPGMVIPVYALHRVIEFVVTQTENGGPVRVSNISQISFGAPVKRPKGMREFDIVSYDSIGGMEAQLRELRFFIELPLLHGKFFNSFGVNTPKGVLISAPDGCGKTMIGKAIKNESPLYFEKISGVDLLTKDMDEAAKILELLLRRAASKAPAIVFIDDLDLILVDGEESKIYLTLVLYLEKMAKLGNVVVIGTTSEAESLSKRLKTTNRFASVIDIPLPGADRKIQIFNAITRGMKVSKNINHIIEKIDIKTPMDIKFACNQELIKKCKSIQLMHETDDNVSIEELSSIVLFEGNEMDDEISSHESVQNTETNSGDPFSNISNEKSNDSFPLPTKNQESDDPFALQNDPFSLGHSNESFSSRSRSKDHFRKSSTNSNDPFQISPNEQDQQNKHQDESQRPQKVKKTKKKAQRVIDPFAPKK